MIRSVCFKEEWYKLNDWLDSADNGYLGYLWTVN